MSRSTLSLAAVLLVVVVLTPACSRQPAPPGIEENLQSLLEESIAEAGFPYGAAFRVHSPKLGIDWQGSTGPADPATGNAMTPDHPVRIASNTKTYIATAILRLAEEDRLDIDTPIAHFLPARFVQTLADDGYRPEKITVRHLLTHTGGLFDHGNAPTYSDDIIANPQHRWTRSEQLALCVKAGDPLGEPGEVYSYSDTGYILLGKILERLTGENLAGAVWGLIDRDRLGLTSTWFETLEPRPSDATDRAHQFIGDIDVSGFDPSFDLWGGGGIATTVGDLALFTRALFTGSVYEKPETLVTMLTTLDGLAPAPGASERSLTPGAYRMGVWVLEFEGKILYRHTGFWCTSATYVPDLDLVVAGTVNQHDAGELFDRIEDEMLRLAFEHAAE